MERSPLCLSVRAGRSGASRPIDGETRLLFAVGLGLGLSFCVFLQLVAIGSGEGAVAVLAVRHGVDIHAGAGRAGVKAIIQPGGSKKDEEAIAVANRYGMAMIFTAQRHFRH